ncbi:hypothetical protein [Foetidibacter luteolus]|uniref:hypothetical protein n=1 Tax=Foetidibacter luteolus TaxID=2608880 RepID=UPI00129AC04E|nr:hypothetical protein [Foetidibacter luteolus]
MKKPIYIIIAFAMVALLTQCRSHTRNWQAYFWTSTKTGIAQYLYINNVMKGQLPYLSSGPDCDDAAAKSRTLHLKLKSGTYDITVKDHDGNISFNETLTIRLSNGNKTISTTQEDKTNGSRNVVEDNCLVHEIYF